MKGPQSEGLTKERLKELYVDDRAASMASVGAILGCNARTVERWLKRYGLPVRTRGEDHGPRKPETRLLNDRAWLEEQLQTKTGKEIAEELGAKEPAVSYWIRKHGLRENVTKSEAIKAAMAKRYPSGRAGKEAANWHGGRSETADGYVYVYAPNHPNAEARGYVLEHRLVMEQHLGRYLEPDEVVHHLNGNKKDNRIENLRLMHNGQHIANHFAESHEVDGLRKRIAELEAEVARLRKELHGAEC